ncbi:3-deoxy-7-phosphoheptulonate synthase [bacterium]|nr:3-deoxy-7-phosphoheptulonate synthase [bacterium]
MIIIMKENATAGEIDHVIAAVRDLGYKPHPIYGKDRTVVAAVGDERGKYRIANLESMPGVDSVVPILKPYKLAGRETHREPSLVTVRSVPIGGPEIVVMAGPCSVESREQILECARIVKEQGCQFLRGGAFKPRTSPYAFQGLAEEGLQLLAEARAATGLAVVTELMDAHNLPLVEKYTDIIQIGARNMQNYYLLSAVGETRKPVLLKRGLASTIQEWLMSAEYILSRGNYCVILCERGIRTFETETRNTLDLSAVPVVKKLSHLPIIVDPSHGTGHWDLVPPMAAAAIAAGADGLMIEVHPHPEEAASDGPQSLTEKSFAALMQEVRRFVDAAGRGQPAGPR